jgi:hypothetical protein
MKSREQKQASQVFQTPPFEKTFLGNFTIRVVTFVASCPVFKIEMDNQSSNFTRSKMK